MPDRFADDIKIHSTDVVFSFERMSEDEQLYEVTCRYLDVDYRFYMKYDTNSCEFKVMDVRNCHEDIVEAEHLVSRAIEHRHA